MRGGRPADRPRGHARPVVVDVVRLGADEQVVPSSRTMSRSSDAGLPSARPRGRDDVVVQLVGVHVRGHDPARPAGQASSWTRARDLAGDSPCPVGLITLNQEAYWPRPRWSGHYLRPAVWLFGPPNFRMPSRIVSR